MSNKQVRMSLKGMSDEEKKERKRTQMREYMAKRRQTDEEFVKSQRELCRKKMTEKRKDAEFNEKHRQYCTEYNKKKKEQIENILPLFQRYLKTCQEYPECSVSLEGGQIWIKTKEGIYIPENKETTSFVERLNNVIQQSDKGGKVYFDFDNNEIEIISKDGFSLFF